MTVETVFRAPSVDDGAAIWRLVKATGRLDLNSAYLYLLLAKHFADTCVVAVHGERLVGFASGYRPPSQPDTIFLWQIGVDPTVQGQGLGRRLLRAFMHSPGARGVRWLETTISPDNTASQALFRGFAHDLGIECIVGECFRAEQFPGGGHEAEQLYRIGPLGSADPNRFFA